MRVILTGGCTGGHIYPALAIGDKFREKNPDNEVIYVAHAYGLETRIVPAAGYELKIVTAQWFDRSNPARLVKTVAETMKGRREAYKIIKEFKPDVVMSTGSFVSVPVVLAAQKAGVPVFIHEQNAFPGISNRLLAGYASKVFLGFNGGHEYFKEPEKLMYVGNPVRREFYDRDRNADRAELGIPTGSSEQNHLVIMIFGGSLGSDAINSIGYELIKEYGGRDNITVIWGTGRGYYKEVMTELKEMLGADSEEDSFAQIPNFRISAYIDNMPAVIGASNLVISRSGALSVAETTMVGRAAIFVPSPNVTADHQYYNAKAVADVGGAIIVREDDNTADRVMAAVKELVNDSDELSEMEQSSHSIAPVNATDMIYDEIMRQLG